MMCSSLVFSLLITDYLQGPTGERSGSLNNWFENFNTVHHLIVLFPRAAFDYDQMVNDLPSDHDLVSFR